MSKLILSEQSATPSTPAAAKAAIYVDNTATPLVKILDDSGVARFLLDNASAQSVTGVKTMTNMNALVNTNTVPLLTLPAGGTVLTAAAAGAVESDGQVHYLTHNTTDGRGFFDTSRFFRLTGPGSAISTIADVFGATSAIGMAANGVYEIEWHVYLVQNTAAATTWTFTITLSGAVTRCSAEYLVNAIAGIGTNAAATSAGNIGFTTTQALPVTGSMAAANHYAVIRAIVDCGATPRDIRLRLTVAANNATPQAGSWYRARHVSSGNTGAFTA